MNILLKKIISVWELFRLAVSGGESNILSGNINRAIILLAIPMTLEMVMESLFAVVDIYFVSKIGINAIAAVGLTESMMTIPYSLGFGVAMGTTALVSRRVGENNINGASISGVQAIYLGTIVSVPIAIVGVLFSEDLLRLMGASDAVIKDGVGYTKLLLVSNLIFILLYEAHHATAAQPVQSACGPRKGAHRRPLRRGGVQRFRTYRGDRSKSAARVATFETTVRSRLAGALPRWPLRLLSCADPGCGSAGASSPAGPPAG